MTKIHARVIALGLLSAVCIYHNIGYDEIHVLV